MRERGLSGALHWDPVEGDRGPSLSLSQTIGGASSGGADALLRRGTLEGLAANDDGADGASGDLRSRRLEGRFGYGFGVFADRWTAVPAVALGLTESAREYSLGGRLFERVTLGPVFGMDLEAVRRESVNAAGAAHNIVLGFGWRLGGAASSGFDLRFELARREAANNPGSGSGAVSAEHSVGVRLGARW